MACINAGFKAVWRDKRGNELGIKQFAHGDSACNACEQWLIPISEPNTIAPKRRGGHANSPELAKFTQLGQEGAVHPCITCLLAHQMSLINHHSLNIAKQVGCLVDAANGGNNHIGAVLLCAKAGAHKTNADVGR